MFKITPKIKEFELNGSFNISRYARTSIVVIQIEIFKNNTVGIGECVPYKYNGETIESLIEQLDFDDIDLDCDVIDGLNIYPTLKNGLTSAYLDWWAKNDNKPVWELLNVKKPDNVLTAYTLSLHSPENMANEAIKHADKPLLKLKLGGDGDVERINAVRNARNDARIIVDANEGWNNDNVAELIKCCESAGVEMIEQPLPKGQDDILTNLKTDICIVADESFNNHNDINDLIGKYTGINIKLDKTGGLIGAIKSFEMAQKNNLKVMVGCMMGSSLSMAPAVIIAKDADWVDLDGSLWVKEDGETIQIKDGAYIQTPSSNLWG
ncbi:MAG: dipeptide epimerase [Alphaproteobacteria bacterium]